jgi:hypothetical protein
MRVLRVVAGWHLRCGCFVGLYETYRGPVVPVIDETGRSCRDPAHRRGHVIMAGQVDCFAEALGTPGSSTSPGVHMS